MRLLASCAERRGLVAVIGLALGLSVPACEERQTTLPVEVLGIYTTSDATYADRHLRLLPTQFVLGLGRDRTERHRIREVYREEVEGRTLFNVVYVDAGGGLDRLAFYHDGRRDGDLVFKNQSGIRWTRGETGS